VARMTLRVGAILVAMTLALPAVAMLPPIYYKEAREKAPNVIIIAVTGVTPPEADYGSCAVAGTVRVVERGTTYRIGEAVVIGVDCTRPDADFPIGGTPWKSIEVLSRSQFGRAYLDAGGKLMLWQYEMLSEDELPD
jgi:hypothetical protein